MHLPGGAVTQARVAGEAPVALLRISDFLNVLSFLAPLWLAAFATVATRARPPRDRAARFSLALPAALALGAFFTLLFGVEPGGGWARDWDVATGPGALAALATAYILVTAWSDAGARPTLAPAATLALAASVALWGIHSSESISLRRVEKLVTAHPLPSAAMRTGVYDFWGVRDLNGGRAAEAAVHFEQAIAIGGPNPRLVYQAGLAYLAAEQLERARSSFQRAASLNRGVADPWRGLARVALIERDTLSTLAALDSVLVRSPGDFQSRRETEILRAASRGRER
jgi:tetratricopeptide (TPR) repeat protein